MRLVPVEYDPFVKLQPVQGDPFASSSPSPTPPLPENAHGTSAISGMPVDQQNRPTETFSGEPAVRPPSPPKVDLKDESARVATSGALNALKAYSDVARTLNRISPTLFPLIGKDGHFIKPSDTKGNAEAAASHNEMIKSLQAANTPKTDIGKGLGTGVGFFLETPLFYGGGKLLGEASTAHEIVMAAPKLSKVLGSVMSTMGALTGEAQVRGESPEQVREATNSGAELGLAMGAGGRVGSAVGHEALGESAGFLGLGTAQSVANGQPVVPAVIQNAALLITTGLAHYSVNAPKKVLRNALISKANKARHADLVDAGKKAGLDDTQAEHMADGIIDLESKSPKKMAEAMDQVAQKVKENSDALERQLEEHLATKEQEKQPAQPEPKLEPVTDPQKAAELDQVLGKPRQPEPALQATEKPQAAPKQQKTSNNLVQRIKQLGGINKAQIADVTGEHEPKKSGTVGLFRKDGQSLDKLATQLQSEGFDINTDAPDGGVEDLTNKIQTALGGEKVLNHAGQQEAADKAQRRAEIEARHAHEADKKLFGPDWEQKALEGNEAGNGDAYRRWLQENHKLDSIALFTDEDGGMSIGGIKSQLANESDLANIDREVARYESEQKQGTAAVQEKGHREGQAGQAEGGVSGRGSARLQGEQPLELTPQTRTEAQVQARREAVDKKLGKGQEQKGAEKGSLFDSTRDIARQQQDMFGGETKKPDEAPVSHEAEASKQFTYKIKPHDGGFVIQSDDGGGVVLAGKPTGPGILNDTPARVFASESAARAYMAKNGMQEAKAIHDDLTAEYNRLADIRYRIKTNEIATKDALKQLGMKRLIELDRRIAELKQQMRGEKQPAAAPQPEPKKTPEAQPEAKPEKKKSIPYLNIKKARDVITHTFDRQTLEKNLKDRVYLLDLWRAFKDKETNERPDGKIEVNYAMKDLLDGGFYARIEDQGHPMKHGELGYTPVDAWLQKNISSALDRVDEAIKRQQQPESKPEKKAPATKYAKGHAFGMSKADAESSMRQDKHLSKLIDSGKLQIVQNADDLPEGAHLYSSGATVGDLWNAIAQSEESFKYPRTDSKSMADIVKETYPAIRVSLVDPKFLADGVKKEYMLRTADGKTAYVRVNKDGTVELNAAMLESGKSLGSAIYHIVGSFAHNNGLTFIGDREGLSGDAMYRRTENMLAMALKYGTTKFLRPHENQEIPWGTNDNQNLRELIRRHYANVYGQVAALRGIRYDPGTGEFEHSDGSRVSDADFGEIADTPDAERVRAGITTLKRAALTHTLVQAERAGTGNELLAAFTRELHSLGRLRGIEGVLYSRGSAPAYLNGQREFDKRSDAIRAADRLEKMGRGRPSIRYMDNGKWELAGNDTMTSENNGDIQGAYLNGKAYVVAGNNSADTIRGTAWHETVHAAMDKAGGAKAFLGDKRHAKLMDELQRIYNEVAKGSKSVDEFFRQAYDRIPRDTLDQHKLDELAGYTVERYVNSPRTIPARIKAWVKDFIAAVKAAIFRHTGKLIGKLDPQDLLAIGKAYADFEARHYGLPESQNAGYASIHEDALSAAQSGDAGISSEGRSRGGVSELYNGFKTPKDIKSYLKWMRSELERGGTIYHIPPEVAKFAYKTNDPILNDYPELQLTSPSEIASEPKGILYGQKAPTFYSHMQRVLEQKLPGSATNEQYAKTIEAMAKKGEFKQEELEWSGVQDWLKSIGPRKVSKQELMDYLRANEIQVQEVTKGSRPADYEARLSELDRAASDAKMAFDKEMEALSTSNHEYGALRIASRAYYDAIKARNDFTRATSESGPKFESYQLRGGKDYHELLLTLPVRKAPFVQPEEVKTLPEGYDVIVDQSQPEGMQYGVTPPGQAHARPFAGRHATPEEAKTAAIERINLNRVRKANEEYIRDQEAAQFKSGHFEEPNILAHVRFNTRTDAEGKKVLFLEEVQSDWHQAGRKKGYFGGGKKPDAEEISDGIWLVTFGDNEAIKVSAIDKNEALDKAEEQFHVGGVPDAPFKTTWPMLVMKRMLRYAAENGYDKVAWTTGEQQASRYDLGKQVDAIDVVQVHDNGNRSVRIDAKDGTSFKILVNNKGIVDGRYSASQFTGKPLDEVVGKDLADKIMKLESPHKFTGLELSVGGEGMKAFYDKMLPSMLDKYIKRFGAKVGKVSMDGSGVAHDDPNREFLTKGHTFAPLEVHGVEITPQMRDSVMQGQPLFSRRRDEGQGRIDLKGGEMNNREPGLPPEKLRQKLERLFIDRFNRVGQFTRITRRSVGKLMDNADPYLQEELFYGKSAEEIESIERKYIEPIADTLAKNDIPVDEFNRYLYALHAPERNAVIAERNPDMPDGGSGMTNAEAEHVIEQVKASGKLEAYETAAKHVRSMMNHNLALMEKYGLESKENVRALADQYKHYVPLRGLTGEEEHALNIGRSTGRGFDIRGKEYKVAMGRKTMADNVLAQAVGVAEATAIRAHKATVGHALLRLYLNNPDPTVWDLNKVEYKRVLDKSGEMVEATDKQPDIPGLQTEKIKTASGQVVYKIDPFWRNKENVVSVKVNGKEFFLTIHDPVMAHQLKRMGLTDMGPVLSVMAKLNIYLSAINTSYNPEFVVTNAFRDFQTAVINMTAEQQKGFATGAAKRVGKSFWAILKAETKDKYAEPATDKYSRYFLEYKRAGGKIAFYSHGDLEAVRRRVERMIRRESGTVSGKAMKTAFTAIRYISGANAAVENAIRLSAFAQAREMGISADQAASIARNLTVNFNRKGEVGPALNALYLFANANIQGAKTMYHAVDAMVKNGTLFYFLGATTALGFALAQIARQSMGQSKDGMDRWDKIGAYEKERNLIFADVFHPGSKKYGKVMLPYGYNIFFNMGYWLNDIYTYESSGGKHGMPPMSVSFRAAGVILNAFNPLGSTNDLFEEMLPSSIRPAYELSVNKDFAGRKIMPDKDPYSRAPIPESARYFKSMKGTWYQKFTSGLNKMTGGDSHVPGAIDISPETVKYMTEFILGGMGKTVSRTDESIMAAIHHNQIDPYNIPFYGRVVGSIPRHEAVNSYYSNIIRPMQIYQSFLARKGADRVQYQKKHAKEIRLAIFGRSIDSEIRKLHKIKNQMEAAGASKEKLQPLDEQITKLATDFNAEYHKVYGAQ